MNSATSDYLIKNLGIESTVQICLLLAGERKGCIINNTKGLSGIIERFFKGVLFEYDDLLTNYPLPKRWKRTWESFGKVLGYTPMGPFSFAIQFATKAGGKTYDLTSMRAPRNIIASQTRKAKAWYSALDDFPAVKAKIDSFGVRAIIPVSGLSKP